MRLWFRLALAFGCTVRELDARMDIEEFNWWLAFSMIEPFGAIHDERRSAIESIASLAPYMKKTHNLEIEDVSGYLQNCADVGTDKASKRMIRESKAHAALSAFVVQPNVRRVDKDDKGVKE